MATLQQELSDHVFSVNNNDKNNNIAFIGVHGPAGIGKSTFLRHIGINRTDKNSCWIVHGKFDHNCRSSVVKYNNKNNNDTTLLEPYQTIRQVVKNLCQQLQQLPTDDKSTAPSQQQLSLSHVQTALRDALQYDHTLLTTVFPAIADLLETENNNDSDNPHFVDQGDNYGDAPVRLQLALQTFWTVVSQWRPLIIVLDDVQYMDPASAALWTGSWPNNLQQEDENTGRNDENGDGNSSRMKSRFAVVAGYRTDGTSSTATTEAAQQQDDPTMAFFRRLVPSTLDNDGNHMHYIPLQEWNVGEVSQVLAQVLGTTSDHPPTVDLATVVVQKTHGNPLYVKHFVQSLVEEEEQPQSTSSSQEAGKAKGITSILSYHLIAGRWIWDIERVRQCRSVTANVVELLQQSLLKHHYSGGGGGQLVRRFLSVAACLGVRFDHATLRLAWRHLHDHTMLSSLDEQESIPKDCLIECINAGFLEFSSDSVVRFVHDQVQEAALGLLLPEELEHLKFQVAHVLLRNLEGSEPDGFIFTTCSLIHDVPVDQDVQSVAARVCFLAGRRAMALAAFEYAAKCFRRSMDLLPDDKWDAKHRGLTVEVLTLAATAESCLGEFHRLESICSYVIENPLVSVVDKAPAYHLLMLRYQSQEDKLDEAFNLGMDLLDLLGARLHVKSANIAWNVSGHVASEGRKKFVQKSVENIESLPSCEDDKEVAIMKTLDIMTSICINYKPAYLPAIALAMKKRNKKHGVSPYSAVSSTLLGGFCAIYMGDLQVGRLYGTKAVELSENLTVSETECRVSLLAHTYVLHWTLPLRKCSKALFDAHEVGLKQGDLNHAFWCLFFHVDSRIFLGGNLAELEREATLYLKKMKDHAQPKVSRAFSLLLQTIQNLRGSATTAQENPARLTGDYVDEKKMLAMIRRENSERREILFLRRVIYLAVYFGDFDRVAEIATRDGTCVVRVGDGQFGDVEVFFACALSCLALARRPSCTRRRRYQRKGLQYVAKMKDWISKGNPNCIVHSAILEAECLSLKGHHRLACQQYQESIRLAGRSGLVNLQALANERLAVLAQGDMRDIEEAEYRFQEARRLYEHWGANGKVAHVEEALRALHSGR